MQTHAWECPLEIASSRSLHEVPKFTLFSVTTSRRVLSRSGACSRNHQNAILGRRTTVLVGDIILVPVNYQMTFGFAPWCFAHLEVDVEPLSNNAHAGVRDGHALLSHRLSLAGNRERTSNVTCKPAKQIDSIPQAQIGSHH